MANRIVLFGAAGLMFVAASVRTAGAQQIASDNTAYGTTAAEFLLMPASARGAALGGSYAALGTDVASLFVNPAGLALVGRPSLLATSMSYVADTRLNTFAVAYPFAGGSRSFGLSYTRFGFSDQPVYTVDDPNGDLGNKYSVNEVAVGATFAQQMSDRFAFGFTAKYIGDKLGDVSGSAFAVDLGTRFRASVAGRDLRAAFVISNLGTTLQHDGNALNATVLRPPPAGQQDQPQEAANARLNAKAWSLPVLFRVALAYDVFSSASSRLSVLGDFTQPNNTEAGYNLAGEYSLKLGSSPFSLAGRVSYSSSPDNNLSAPDQNSGGYAGFSSTLDGSGSDGFAAGGGLAFSRGRGLGLSFDYAYRSLGILGGANMVTVGVTW